MTLDTVQSTETVQSTDTAQSVQPARRITARTIQIGLGIIWLADGLFQLQPKMLGTAFANGVIVPSAQGQPAIISSVITHTAHLMAAQPVPTDLVFAGIQLLIGAGLLIRETVKPALVLSFVWALGVWSLGEGFGGLFNGTAMPLTGAPGAALLYLAIGLLIWPRRVPRDAHGPAAAAAEGPLGEGGGIALWALVWCGFGLLWLLPASSKSGALSAALKSAAAGEPGWLSHLQLSVAHSLGNGGGSVAIVAAFLSFFIGVGPVLFRHYGIFLIAGVAMALDFWVLGQAFGQIFTGMATDPNTGPLLVLLALAVYRAGVPAEAPAEEQAPEPAKAF
ncbi:MAG: hypothetical protein ABSH29_10260 [Acidimicrobiales bacterium]